ncbi:MAG: tetratricopeptide repeat protein [Candidatus Riflebacteria bacterium]|nr:tetratricopeptide repeat protein [Candidatus Riflebacteria bacterium]
MQGGRPAWALRFLLCLLAVLGALAPSRGMTSRACRDALAAEPGSLRWQIALAEALRAEGQSAAALLALTEARTVAPRCAAVRFLEGEILLDQGRYEAARQAFEAGGELAPDAPDAWYGLIRLHRALRNWEAVLALCRDLRQRDPDHPFAVLNEAWAHFNLRQYEEADRLYSHPRHGRTRLMRLGKAWTRLRLGNVEEAGTLFRALLQEDPADADAAWGLREAEGVVLYKGLAGWGLSVNDTPAEVAALLDRAARFAALGRQAEAIDLWFYALKGDPGNATACLGLAAAYAAQGDPARANYYYSVILNRGWDPDAARGRIRALGALGAWSEAASFSADLLQRVGTDSLALGTMAWFRYSVGDFEEAYRLYERAGPQDPTMTLGRAWCRFMQKDYPASRTLFREVLASQPANPGAIEGLALIENLAPGR